MSEGGQIQFRSLDIAPDFQHVPEANVVKEENGIVFELDRLKIVEEQLLLPAIFRCVNEDEVSFGEEGFVLRDLGWLRDIVDVLHKRAIGEIGLGEDSGGILPPGNDIERGESGAFGLELFQAEGAAPGRSPDFYDEPRLKD